MIGRDTPVKGFDLIRWARRQAVESKLRPLEAHVLLVLATYANEDCVAWPSIKTLAEASGLKPTAAVSRGGVEYHRNSAVSAALQGLEDRQLIWTKQGGHGRSAERELLYNPQPEPSASAEGSPPSKKDRYRGPKAEREARRARRGAALQSLVADGQPSGYADAAFRPPGTEGPEEGPVRTTKQKELPRQQSGEPDGCSVREGGGLENGNPSEVDDGEREQIRRAIRGSLAAGGAR